jgi:AmmeMemoRadiSam system protein B
MLKSFCPNISSKRDVIGLMVPHAGYIYSGAIAGQTYDKVNVPDRVILLGPNHHGVGHSGAVYATGSWTTPLGQIFIDENLAQQLLDASEYLQSDTRAHQAEHSLEVQVPFIQYLNPQAELVPICLSYQPLLQLLAIAETIAAIIRNSDNPVLLIASTDMTHFESAETAKRKDQIALDCVAQMDAEGLFKTVVERQISMCGFIPTVILLKVAKLLGCKRSEITVYGNSGDVTKDYSDVVAYAGALIG